jgi:hypothetical protein
MGTIEARAVWPIAGAVAAAAGTSWTSGLAPGDRGRTSLIRRPVTSGSDDAVAPSGDRPCWGWVADGLARLWASRAVGFWFADVDGDELAAGVLVAADGVLVVGGAPPLLLELAF